MSEQELSYWLAFARFEKIGGARLTRLLKSFPSVKEIWDASSAQLLTAGLDEKIAAEFSLAKKDLSPEKELSLLAAADARAVTFVEDTYPRLLKQTYQAPPVLFYRGNLRLLSEQTLAVVGTRSLTAYGARAVEQLVPELVAHGLAIISGLALGTDAAAHLATLNARGTTYAVLGSGLDDESVYPSSHRPLARRVLENNGLLFSEYPPGTPALKHHFPLRNRIISGLARGTLVIEAPASSGALITARFALEQNREVFAVPGPIHAETSAGTNELIKKGAKLVACTADILEEFNIQEIKTFTENRDVIPDTPQQAQLLQLLASGPKHVNEMIQNSALTAREVNSALTLLEMQGRVRQLGGMMYSRVS